MVIRPIVHDEGFGRRGAKPPKPPPRKLHLWPQLTTPHIMPVKYRRRFNWTGRADQVPFYQ